MEEKAKDRRGTIISLVSGKGGVGKTTVCLAMGTILSHFGRKTILVDLDMATHGMTYFFMDNVKKENTGTIDLLKNPKLKVNAVNYKQNYDVLPSSTKLTTPDTAFMSSISEAQLNGLRDLLYYLSNQYDYVLIDCQAGANVTVREAIEASDKVVIVAEADPVSVWSIKNIEYEFGKLLPSETFGLINKLFLEERERYRDIVDYGRLMKFLPPLPFDLEVRRFFARRLIPSNLEEPSEFFIGLCYAIKDLLPEVEKGIDEFLGGIKALKVGDLENDIKKIDAEIDAIRSYTMDVDFKKARMGDQVKLISALGIAVISLFIGMWAVLRPHFDINVNWIIAIIGVLIAGVAQAYAMWIIKTRRAKRMRAREEREYSLRLEELTGRRHSMEILLEERKRRLL